MANMIPGRMRLRPGYRTRSYVTYVRNGQLIAQAWPPKTGPRKQPYMRAAVRRFQLAMHGIKYWNAEEQQVMQQGIDEFLADHRGLRATAAIRLRDLLFKISTGTLFTITGPDGTAWHNNRVQKDVSDILDWTEPRVGSMLTKANGRWLPTVMCKPGMVCVSAIDGPIPGCCPPASQATGKAAVGGY